MLTGLAVAGVRKSMLRSDLLLVEDDPQIVRALVPALEVCGYRVTGATNGASALTLLAASSWDAVVLDLGLPDIDGREVLRHIRRTRSIPVIVISARHSAPDQIECDEAGATASRTACRGTRLIRCLAQHCADRAGPNNASSIS